VIDGSVLEVADMFPAIERAYRSGGRAPLNLSRLLLDVRVTFPKLLVELRPISRRLPGAELIWMIAASEDALMPDGNPFFLIGDAPEYSDGIHAGFDAWLDARGWYIERYSTAWYIPTRLPTDEERAQWLLEEAECVSARIGPPTRDQLDQCPF
jgi:hypothetical protein